MGEGLISLFLGWLKMLAEWVLGLFDLSGSDGTSPLTYFSRNWYVWLIVLLVIGTVTDIIVWMVRWRPYWVWTHQKRVIIHDDAFFSGKKARHTSDERQDREARAQTQETDGEKLFETPAEGEELFQVPEGESEAQRRRRIAAERERRREREAEAANGRREHEAEAANGRRKREAEAANGRRERDEIPGRSANRSTRQENGRQKRDDDDLFRIR